MNRPMFSRQQAIRTLTRILPVVAGLYYTRTEYKLDGDSEVADNTKLKRNEYGFKVGIAF